MNATKGTKDDKERTTQEARKIVWRAKTRQRWQLTTGKQRRKPMQLVTMAEERCWKNG